MAKNKGTDVSEAVKAKLTAYVYKKYKSYTDKDLIIKDRGTHYTVVKHISVGPLYLSKDVIN